VLEVCLVRSSISLGLSLILMHLCGMRWQLFFGKRENLKLLTLRGCCGACSMVSTASQQPAPPRLQLLLTVAKHLVTTSVMLLLQTTYYVALFMLPLGDAVTINLIGPPVTAIFARVFLKEPLGYAVCLLGCCPCQDVAVCMHNSCHTTS
jgi:threonine/homoserine efflux transporter RhtA